MARRSLLLRILLSALVALGLAAAAACSSTTDDDADDDDQTEERDRDNDGIPDTDDKCLRDKETKGGWDDDSDGCPDTIKDLMQLAYDDVGAFWEVTFEDSGEDYEPPTEYVAYTTEIETACGEAVLNNAFYCPRSHAIYYDETFLQDELDTNGDFGPVFVIAHEWGHLVQGLLGLLGGDRYTIDVELQADCLAGAYTTDAEVRGVLEEGDFDEAVISLFRVGDPMDTPWYDPQAHGTSGERIDAFNKGYQRGVGSCLDEY